MTRTHLPRIKKTGELNCRVLNQGCGAGRLLAEALRVVVNRNRNYAPSRAVVGGDKRSQEFE